MVERRLTSIRLHYFYRDKEFKCSAVVCKGIAAMLFSGVQTSHSLFKFPIPVLENSVNSIKSISKPGRQL